MDKSIGLTLGKLLVAVAWADGELQEEEIQILKDLIYKIPDITRDDWASIEVYMESPITADECVKLMGNFTRMIRTPDEKEFALKALQDIIHADGEVDEGEKHLYNLLSAEIMQASTGFDRKLQDLFKSARNKRRETLGHIPRRERNIEEFLENPIFYRSFRKLTEQGVSVHMDKSELEKLCVAGALMACVAQADGEIHPNEVNIIKRLLMKYWHIGNDAASIVAEIAVNQEVSGMDILRMCRKFFSETEADSRLDFVKALVGLVKSDYEVHANELERLRAIAINLKIPQATMLELIPKVGPLDASEVDDLFSEDEADQQRAEAMLRNKRRSLVDIVDEDFGSSSALPPKPAEPKPAKEDSGPRFMDI